MYRRMEVDHSLTPNTKINLKWIKDLNVRQESIKILKENIDSNLFDISHSNFFFFQLLFLFSIPEFTVYAPHPVLHAIRALHNTHRQSHPTYHPPPLQNPQFVSQSPQSLMVHLPLQFPPTHFPSPPPNVLHVIPYGAQISETIGLTLSA